MEKDNMRNEEVIEEWCASPPMGNLRSLTSVFVSNDCSTFLGEKTPKVPPSSRIATPISASKASLL